MTMDPSVLSLAQIIQSEGAYMEQIVSYNPVSMGNVTNYISKDQIQASAQGSSSGLAYFTTSFYVFVKNLISYSGDLAIKAMAELDGEYMSVVIGDSMVEVLKMKDALKSMNKNTDTLDAFEACLYGFGTGDLLESKKYKEKKKQTMWAMSTNPDGTPKWEEIEL